VIALPSESYNTAFGGDPAAGTLKTSKIQYLFNNKPGQISVPENALIILPAPK